MQITIKSFIKLSYTIILLWSCLAIFDCAQSAYRLGLLQDRVLSFFDDFDDGYADDWIEGIIADYEVVDGEYSISTLNHGNYEWTLRSFEPNHDFTLEAKVMYLDGDTCNTFGIGVVDGDSNFTGILISRGSTSNWNYYVYLKNTYIYWGFRTTNTDWNSLTIEKSDDSLRIIMNNSTLVTLQNVNENIVNILYVCLHVGPLLHIHFDDIDAQSE